MIKILEIYLETTETTKNIFKVYHHHHHHNKIEIKQKRKEEKQKKKKEKVGCVLSALPCASDGG